MAQFYYDKLMPRILGPFCVVSVTLHTLSIDEHGIRNTVTIDSVSPTANKSQESSTTQLKTAKHGLATDLPETDCSESQSSREYAADRTVGHKGSKARICFKVRRYEYHPWVHTY